MKLKLPNKQLAVCLLTLCSGFLHTALYADVVDSRPPLRNPNEAARLSTFSSNSEVQVVAFYHADYVELNFFEEATDVQVAVYSAAGMCVAQLRGSVAAYSSFYLDARSWQGSYTIVVKIQNRTKQLSVAYSSNIQ